MNRLNKRDYLFYGETGTGKTKYIPYIDFNNEKCYIDVAVRKNKTLEQIFASEKFKKTLEILQKHYGVDNVQILIDEVHVTITEINRDVMANLDDFKVLHSSKIQPVLLATMHEHHMENVDYKKEICTKLAERVLLDCFLVKLLMKY